MENKAKKETFYRGKVLKIDGNMKTIWICEGVTALVNMGLEQDAIDLRDGCDRKKEAGVKCYCSKCVSPEYS